MATSSPKLPQDDSESQPTDNNKAETAITGEMQGQARKSKPIPKTITPEPRTEQPISNPMNTPSTPGIYQPFNWEEFEARYEKALAEADGHEREVLVEFDRLVKYYNVWASASSAHDNERATKRLQTRQRYVTLAEDRMSHKQQHYSEVMRAFQTALALLSQQGA